MERSAMNQKNAKGPKVDTRKKPVKVVYISNPMRFVATPDEFRSVVQRLTGQQSNIVDFAEAAGFPTAGIGNGLSNMETSIIDQACQLAYAANVNASCNGYLYEGFANEYDTFGDLSSVCLEPLRY